MTVADTRPTLVERCPRCGERTLKEPIKTNALSRTTRGYFDEPVWVCSDCGTDEALEDYFLDGATIQDSWPMESRSFPVVINDMSRVESAVMRENRA